MASVNEDVLEMARGLFDSRVIVKRPPSAAQRRAYHAPPKGPPMMTPKEKRPLSAKARMMGHEESELKKASASLPPHPPWRPFVRASSLSKMDTVQGCLYTDTSKSEDLKKEKEDAEEVSSVYQNRKLPQGLMALSEWLTEEVPSDWAKGYSPESSFVFLPCLQNIKTDLPCVPMVQEPGDQLPYTPSPQTQKLYKPPRPKTKKNTDSQQGHPPQPKPADNSDEESSKIINHIRMYNSEGELVHDIYRGKRGAELIRQEIRDLELLLQGIGNPEGSSIFVRYQYDINHLQDMVKSTLKDYVFPEDARPQTPVAAALQEDLMKYPAKHDEIMASIQKRRDECVEELATIEAKILKRKT